MGEEHVACGISHRLIDTYPKWSSYENCLSGVTRRAGEVLKLELDHDILLNFNIEFKFIYD